MASTHLLIIDPQNDFCDTPEYLLPISQGVVLRPTLGVPGAHDDMLRLAHFITSQGDRIDDITVTLDSHAYSAIERTTFWVDSKGKALEPFTTVMREDVEQGRYAPRHHWAEVLAYLEGLERRGRKPLVVWPVHCVTGTWGHAIQTDVNDAINAWESLTGNCVHKISKGVNPLNEHYGALEAEVPIEDVPSTLFNTPLAKRLTAGVDRLYVAGEASSHCVAQSMYQLHKYMQETGATTEIILLSDCMSPVPGFGDEYRRLMQWSEGVGMRIECSMFTSLSEITGATQ